MAIAFDNAQASRGAVSPLTVSYTATGSNLTLIVMVNEDASGNVTSVTWNGTGMTKVTGSEINGGGGVGWLVSYILPGAASGTHNLVVTANVTSTFSVFIASYSGTSGTQPDASANVTTTTGNTCNGSVTTVADNSWPVMFVQAASGTISAGSGASLRVAGNSGGILDIGAKTPAGSATVNANISASLTHAANLVSIAPLAIQNLTLTAAVGTFALTGNTSTIGRLLTLVASVGSYILSGIATALRYTAAWHGQTKNTSSFTAETKNTSTFTPESK